MKDMKDVLLYLDSFDENNMFDFEHNNKLYNVSEVLKFKMYDRIEKYDLNYCEDAILNLNDLTVKITDMINLKKPNVLQEIKKMYNGVLQYENNSDTECESIDYDDWDMLSKDSDTGEIIGFRNIKSRNRDYIQTYCNDRKNSFHFACRQWYSYNNPGILT